jgi:hypothetical protein
LAGSVARVLQVASAIAGVVATLDIQAVAKSVAAATHAWRSRPRADMMLLPMDPRGDALSLLASAAASRYRLGKFCGKQRRVDSRRVVFDSRFLSRRTELRCSNSHAVAFISRFCPRRRAQII